MMIANGNEKSVLRADILPLLDLQK